MSEASEMGAGRIRTESLFLYGVSNNNCNRKDDSGRMAKSADGELDF